MASLVLKSSVIKKILITNKNVLNRGEKINAVIE